MEHLGHLAPAVERFGSARILCVGDIMLDRYVLGRVDRISPEAPIPVLAINTIQSMLGAGGNVASNIASLGGRVTLVGAVGDDEEGRELVRLVAANERIAPNLVTIPGRATTLKMRFVAAGQQLLRADREDIVPISADAEAQIIAAVSDEIADVDLLIVSDYAKGLLTPAVTRESIRLAGEAGKPVIVDPKSDDLARYSGATLIKPNTRELERATGMPCRTDAEVEMAARSALGRIDVQALLVTRSEKGMMLVPKDGAARVLSAVAREVFDVSGAGDTSISALALGLACGLGLEDASALANQAAGLVVAKRGTAVLFPAELMSALHTADIQHAEMKIKELPQAADTIAQWRARGLKIAFTNGCFDLLHTGHVSLLAEARSSADRLIVALNTDSSVRRLKGETRPINAEMARAVVLASLASVDMVVLFDEETPMRLIETLRPDVLVKGADYTIDKVVGAEFVQSYGGRVHLAALVPGMSTTRTIERIAS